MKFNQATKFSNFRAVLLKGLLWAVTVFCFSLVYLRIDRVANESGQSAWEYLADFFQQADWLGWLGLMIPYSIFFFLVDSHAMWRVIRWFTAPNLRLRQILPVRASAYILSLLNEQVGKGAISLYLLKQHQVPLWKALSCMIYLGMAEIYQLCFFATLGLVLYFDPISQITEIANLMTIMIAFVTGVALYFPLHFFYFKGKLLPGFKLRDQPILHAFRQSHLVHYLLTLVFKAPNMIGAVVVYVLALSLFNVSVDFGRMLTFLPMIFLAASLPLPFHAGGLLLWTFLYPEFPEVSAFALIMSVFFVSFNALVGVFFLPKVNRELFAKARS